MNVYRTLIILSAFGFMSYQRLISGGITLITHGNGSNPDGWVSYMATRIDERRDFPGFKASFYNLRVDSTNGLYTSSWSYLGGVKPLSSDSGEVVVLVDWRTLANINHSTTNIATAVASSLLSPAFLSELNGRALVELPIHLIGHSRGTSLNSEICKVLGMNGVWVDHLTTLDGFALVVDTYIVTYENILFHDNYWQDFPFVVHGNPITGAYNRYLVTSGGYFFESQNHSDVHLWYHGTVDVNTPTSDGSASIGDFPERYLWFTGYEQRGTNAGFVYSQIGGGNRTSTDRPNGSGTDEIRAGFNQRYDLGIGVATNNRVALPSVTNTWPNPIRFFLTGTNAIGIGESTAALLYYQWARPPVDSAEVSVYLDTDANPWNGNEMQLTSLVVPGTTSGSVRSQTLTLIPNGVNPGTYRLFVRMQDGARRRLLYAQNLLTIKGTPQPLRLSIAKSSGTNRAVTVHGSIGQRYALESSDWLLTWQSRFTNIMVNGYATFEEPQLPFSRYYRARSLP